MCKGTMLSRGSAYAHEKASTTCWLESGASLRYTCLCDIRRAGVSRDSVVVAHSGSCLFTVALLRAALRSDARCSLGCCPFSETAAVSRVWSPGAICRVGLILMNRATRSARPADHDSLSHESEASYFFAIAWNPPEPGRSTALYAQGLRRLIGARAPNSNNQEIMNHSPITRSKTIDGSNAGANARLKKLIQQIVRLSEIKSCPPSESPAPPGSTAESEFRKIGALTWL